MNILADILEIGMKLCRYCANLNENLLCELTKEEKGIQSRACERHTLPLLNKNAQECIKLSPKEKDLLEPFINAYDTIAIEGNRNKIHLERITINQKPHDVNGMTVYEERESVSEVFIQCRGMFDDLTKFKKYNIKALLRGDLCK